MSVVYTFLKFFGVLCFVSRAFCTSDSLHTHYGLVGGKNHQDFSLDLNQDLSGDDEYSIFEQHVAKGLFPDASHHRSKRFLVYNTATNIALAVIFGFPITLVLPTLTNVFTEIDNFFNLGRRKRSASANETLMVLLENDNLLQDHSMIRPNVKKISAYFEHVNIPVRACQLRTICELSADQENFFPFSDIVLSKVRDENIPVNLISSEKKSLYVLFNDAADAGEIHGYDGCSRAYQDICPYRTEDLLNMPALRFWRVLSSVLNLKFHDNGL